MRYAIYFSPAFDTALWQFGCSAIGYDSWRGEMVPLLNHPVYEDPAARSWLSGPARYGFHATLKAPFELAEGFDERDLRDVAAGFAERRTTFVLPELVIRPMGRLLALVPAEPSPQINDLAADCTRAFERFRAPLTPADFRRRLASPLSPRQLANLDKWGYPYVFDDFRFHMTLCGAVEDPVRRRLQEALHALYKEVAAPVSIDAITICRQDIRDDRFRVLQRFHFGG